LSPTFANIDLSMPDPIPTILASPEFQKTVQTFANGGSIKNALVSPDAQALLYCLIRLLRPKLAIEIGTYLASTTRAMACAIADNGEGRLHTVDPFSLRGALNIALWPRGLRKVTNFHLCNSMRYFARMQRDCIRTELVFIDGNHDYEFALFDIEAAARVMNPGGFILIDNIAQPGPFMAAHDFIMRSNGWRECGGSLKRFNSAKPFDPDRTTVHNTDFCILRAPAAFSIGARPVGFGNLPWTSRSRALRLRLQHEVTGRLQAQFIIRTFGDPNREIIAAASIESVGATEIDIPVPFPHAHGKFRKTVEPWLIWEGTGDLQLKVPPEIV
jgi:predicted O-methyltransferase YrrM